MTDTELITIVAAAFAGALLSGVAGWWDSHEPFDARKFMATIWRALFAAMSFAFTNQFVSVEGAVWIWAFLGGAGVDVLGNRIQGGIGGKNETQLKIEELDAKFTSITEKLEPILVTMTALQQDKTHPKTIKEIT